MQLISRFMFLLCCLPLQLLAQEQVVPSVQSEALPATYLFKLILGLVVVLAMVFAFAWAMKKFHLAQPGGDGPIKLLSAIAVGQRERIALLEVGEEQILVSLAPGRVEKLHELKTRIDMSSVRGRESDRFRQRFNQLMKKGQSDAVA